MATKTCTRPDAKDGKHSWTFVKNITVRNETIRTVRLSVRGVYRCACSAVRGGRANPNAPGSSL